MSKIAIAAETLAPAAGPFSAAVRSQGLIFVSGQVGIDPVTQKLVPGGIEAQAAQALKNLRVVLAGAGKSLDDAVRVGVYLTSMADFALLNALYAKHFNAPYPARTTIAVAALPLGAAVEIDMVVE